MVLVYTTDFSKIPYKNKVFSQFRDKLTLGAVPENNIRVMVEDILKDFPTDERRG